MSSSERNLVTIVCDPEAANTAETIEGLLKDLGVVTEVVSRFEDVNPDSELTLVLQAEVRGEAFNTYALEQGITWLPVQFSNSAGRIGPIIVPNCSACFECVQLRTRSHGLPLLESKSTIFDLSWSVLSGIIAIEAVKWITRQTNSFPPLSLGHIIEFDPFHLQGDVNPAYKLPTCPSCGARQQAHLAAQSWHEAELVLEP
ncbi:hypothetical protein AMS62_05850 [Bacillus sp. FJAT-18019]|nr:hypothetical protein AMS62_05850 [Bacillus sp. FJAT-18019]